MPSKPGRISSRPCQGSTIFSKSVRRFVSGTIAYAGEQFSVLGLLFRDLYHVLSSAELCYNLLRRHVVQPRFALGTPQMRSHNMRLLSKLAAEGLSTADCGGIMSLGLRS